MTDFAFCVHSSLTSPPHHLIIFACFHFCFFPESWTRTTRATPTSSHNSIKLGDLATPRSSAFVAMKSVRCDQWIQGQFMCSAASSFLYLGLLKSEPVRMHPFIQYERFGACDIITLSPANVYCPLVFLTQWFRCLRHRYSAYR